VEWNTELPENSEFRRGLLGANLGFKAGLDPSCGHPCELTRYGSTQAARNVYFCEQRRMFASPTKLLRTALDTLPKTEMRGRNGAVFLQNKKKEQQ
jgi:hypothetical protein